MDLKSMLLKPLALAERAAPLRKPWLEGYRVAEMPASAKASRSLTTAGGVLSAVIGGIQWGLDRMLSVGYGVVYDYIFERFKPYQSLQREVLGLVAATVPQAANRRDFQILEIGCGPGNFTFTLAEAGFSVVGIESYGTLVELAREKRRAKRLSNLTFQKADLAKGNSFSEGNFDQVLNIHSLYVHPAPLAVLREAYRILKPGGHAVFVNHTRRVGMWSTFREVKKREGLGAAFQCMLWVLPNSIFEATRKRVGPHYWSENEFSRHLKEAGFTVLEMRRTFLNEASLLVWARKEAKK